MQATIDRPKRKPRSEKFFVSVATDDMTTEFFNATEHLKKPMPFKQPLATCAMRATSDTISFSLLHLTKRSRANIAGQELQMPHGPLSRLDRKALQLGELGDDDIIVEHGVDDENRPQIYKLKISRDENQTARLEMAEGDDVTFEMPKSAISLSIYLKAPRLNRVIGVQFIGHIGKPGDDSTLLRAVSMALFSLARLTEFKILSEIGAVDVPPAPARSAVRRPVKVAKAEHIIPVRLFQVTANPDGGEPIVESTGEGQVAVAVDLENANPTSNRLLFHYTPSETLAEVFSTYRSSFDRAVAELTTLNLGVDDVTSITYEIVLGAVETSTVGRLVEALKSVGGLDLTPDQYRQLALAAA